MKKKDKFLTIGQFATMHGINKKTLMWYPKSREIYTQNIS